VWAAIGMSARMHAQTNPLAYTPVDAQYSTALDRIIMVSASPNQLHVYDPITQGDTVVGLPKQPYAVSVSPDGLYAAVAHDALISYVNLSPPALQASYPIPMTAQTVILSESWVYVLPTYEGDFLALDLATGVATVTGLGYASGGRLNAAVNAIYGTDDGISPESLIEYNIAAGPFGGSKDSPYWGNYEVCGNIWFSPDGTRIYNRCATVYQASTDPAKDMLYYTTFTGISSIGALAESASLNEIAVVQSLVWDPSLNDGVVFLFDSHYLQPIGQLTLPGFTAGGSSLSSHGKWVFFNNASTNLFVLMQGQTSSGTAAGFAVQAFSLAPPSPCGATFASPTASVAAAGSLGTVGISAAATCIYQAASDSSWLQIVSGGYGSGNGTLTYIARANTSTSQRVGNISIAGQHVAITQAGALPPTAFAALAYNVVDAAYSSALDRIVFAAANPNELHVYDPVTQADTVVPLSIQPLSVSVDPAGTYAAVGHTGWVSYVNLETGTVQQIYTVNTTASYVVAAGNGYLYVFPAFSDANIYSLQTATGTQTAASSNAAGPARLYPDGQAIYQTGGYGFAKWDIAAGLAVNENPKNSPDNCGNFWIAADGSSIVTECGIVYSASENAANDLQYEGMLSNSGYVVGAAEPSAQQSLATIPIANNQTSNDTQVQVYGGAYLGYAGTLALPQFTAGGTSYAGHGKFVFWNSAGASLYVVEQADSTAQLLSSYAVDTISPSTPGSGCSFALGSKSANEPAGLGFDSVSVTTSANCVWSASSGAAWLTITAGAFGFGSGDLAFSFPANPAAATRTATLTIAGQTFTVTQAAGTLTTYTIAGQVTHAGTGLGGVNILLSTGGTITTDSSGYYSFTNLAQGGSYTVTPILEGYSFSPPGLTFSNLGSDQIASFQANLQYDFNGGPGPDVVWEDPTSGFAQIWYLGGPQGVTTTGAADLTQSNPWRIVGIADFNGDGTPDVLWQDPVSGAVQVWYMGGPIGNVLIGSADIANRNAWRVVSVADFNRDGHPDILWQDPVSGFSQIWYMGGGQGVTILGAANLDQTNPWNIVGCADFNGDGVPDVLWQDPQSGTVQIWYMGGTEAGAQGSQLQTAVNLTANPWRVAAIADFNLDGHPDVVFQDPVTGGAQVFFYTGALGTTLSGTAVLSGPNPWSVAGPH